MIHLTPSPCPIEALAAEITDTLFPPNWDREGREKFQRKLVELVAEARREMQTEIDDLRTNVIAFCGPWAVTWARDFNLPNGHLHPTHYDILARAGARMDDFTRAEVDAA